MKSSWALYVVALILFLNVIAVIASFLYDEKKNPEGEISVKNIEGVETKEDENEVDQKSENELAVDDNKQNDDISNEMEASGKITDIAPFVSKVVASIGNAKEKSLKNQELMNLTGKWIATDYESGDIEETTYTVQRGDTLWEISEGFYGDGSRWREILNLNIAQIGFLPNGQQAKILPGQQLVLK